jgi:hypothetical protein
MQPDSIVLTVDLANDGTTADQTYSRFDKTGNKSVYIGAAHVPEARDMFALYRTPPTRSGNFKGVSKSAVKFTEDVSIAGYDSATTLTAPMILDVSFSIPVGATDAQAEELRQRAIAFLDGSTIMEALNKQLMI